PSHAAPVGHRARHESLQQAQIAIDEFLANLPPKVSGRTLRVLIRPFGRVRKAPSAKLDSKVARMLQTPRAPRSRIGRGPYCEPPAHT
ncbi:DUF1974 domain-containing protein, partial [Vibrio parahaemolyticus]|nr:DUF1974 domain-containing protein [Vibrio parahaemolyticus]